MIQAANEALLVGAVDRVGQVVLFPERDEPRVRRPSIAEPENLERVGDRILLVGVVIKPLQVGRYFLR